MSSFDPKNNAISISENDKVYTLHDDVPIIKVNSIREEKEYIARQHPEFEMLLQELIHVNHKGKIIPVDVLTVGTNDGEKKYFFDISSLFAAYDTLANALSSNTNMSKNAPITPPTADTNSYKAEIEKYTNTLYGQELEKMEKIIYKHKWVLPNEEIPDDFFWEQFFKNERAIALTMLSHKYMLKSWKDADKIPQQEIYQMITKQIRNMKSSARVYESPSETARLDGMITAIRMQLGDLPAVKGPARFGGYILLAVMIIFTIALFTITPILGIISTICLIYLIYMFWPKTNNFI